MGKRAALFPGQGAQKVGMGQTIAEKCPAAREVFDRANEALGFDLAAVCFEGPEERLKDTEVQQPAIFTVTMAAVEAWRAEGGEAAPIEAAAGLSLGEYAALAYAGVFSFEDGVRLVRKRGRFMHEAAERNPGGAMASIIGLTAGRLQPLAEQAAAKGPLVLANYNSPLQTVASGLSEAIDEFCTLATEAGAKRCIKLGVSGAFHSPLMQPAAERLAAELDAISLSPARIPVIANVTAQAATDPDEIRKLLVAQLTCPVLWVQSMAGLIARGFGRFVEIGPGRVLAGLLKRTDRSVEIENYQA